MMNETSHIPSYGYDLFSEAAIRDPYEHYADMREMGPVVYLESSDCYAVTRYDECRTVLMDPGRFVSGRGIALNVPMNAIEGSIITSDGARHAFMRKIEGEPLAPKAVMALRTRIVSEAEALADTLLAKGDAWYDAVSDIAHYLPLTVVMELGGLPSVGRAEMLRWAAAAFDLLGPMNERAQQALPVVEQLLNYVMAEIDRDTVLPNSWAARAFELADEGVVPHEMVATILSDFIAPSLDTTIAGTSNLLMLLGQNPDQWALLQSDRGKIPNAINEALRLGTPIRCFSRFVPEDTDLCGIPLKSESRIAVFYASANRDERKFAEPDRFDVLRRNAGQQLAFGAGAHQCLGANLARLEMTAVLNALLDRVDRFEIGEPVYSVNNLLRTLGSLPIRLHASGTWRK